MANASSRASLRLGAVTASLLLAACGGDSGTPPAEPQVLTLEVVTDDVVVVPAYGKRLQVRVVDGEGRSVRDAWVRFEAAPGHGFVEGGLVATGGDGKASVLWGSPEETGTYAVSASIEAPDDVVVTGSPATISASVRSFGAATDDVLAGLPFQIEHALQRNVAGKPLNPGLAGEFDRKIELLSRPNLDSEIIREERFLTRAAPSVGGAALSVDLVFPGPDMRASAERSSALIPAATARLEAFFATPFPAGRILMWYGFQLGSSGGGGTLYLEDRETYERRGNGTVPFDGIVVHELAHSFMAHESLTQFLELLLLNVERHGSTSLESWTHTRGYAGPSSSNTGVHALLDIYAMIGYEAMAEAYRNVEPSEALYGHPLGPSAQQAFVDAAPAAVRTAVAQAVARIGT